MAKNTESVKLTGPTRISGGPVDAGDSVKVYPFQKRQMVFNGQAEGSIQDAFSPGEIESGAPNVLKRASERDDVDGGVWSVDRVYEENDIGQGGEGQTADGGQSKSSKK